MTLADYIAGRGVAVSKLARLADVSEPTLRKAVQGEPIGLYPTAKRISEATGGEVSVEELCEPGAGEAA